MTQTLMKAGAAWWLAVASIKRLHADNRLRAMALDEDLYQNQRGPAGHHAH